MSHSTPDIIVGNKDGPNEIYLGDPTRPGTFDKAPLTFGSAEDATTDVEVIDLDGDGALDILVANDGQPNKVYYGDPALLAGTAPSYGTDPSKESTLGTGSGPSTSVEVKDLKKRRKEAPASRPPRKRKKDDRLKFREPW